MTHKIKLPKLKCLRPNCGHEWIPRSEERPKVCPKCKSRVWDKPKVGRVLTGETFTARPD